MDQLDSALVIHLGAQAADGDFHHIGVAVEIHVPHQGNNLCAGQHFAGLAHQHLQQGELLGGQVDAPGAAISAVAARVQFQVRDAEHFRLWNALLRRIRVRTRASSSGNSNGLTR